MKRISQHTEWLWLIEVSGPFLVVSELERVFPQGLDVVETPRRQRLRAAYEEWCDAVEEDDTQLAELHKEWIHLVLSEILEYDSDVLIPNGKLDAPLSYISPEHAGTFSPDFVIRGDSDNKPKLIISFQPPGTDLEKVKVGDGWPASLLERMTLLCRQNDIRLGLLTNGECWMLVNAPVGSTSGNASWYARYWFQEPITLKAFQSLLGIRRCFGPKEESLEALLEESLKHQEEVTDTLGEQVKRAVEVLVQCLDKADQDRNRELLRDVPPVELYEAGLTVMMRLVFILCAEERGLLLLDEQIYEQYYAIYSLRAQLDEEAPEILERRHDAWARLLAVFRAVYGGIEHETLRMPALGGSLFDPDRFPFLEGRTKGTSWRETAARPLPIDNRTVLLLLNALQILEQQGGALLLSYKALDVEQIGHVYEGLLEHTVARVPEITLGLQGSQKAKNPNLPLAKMESACLDGIDTLVSLIEEATKRSAAAIKNALEKKIDDAIFAKVVAVCGGDTELAKRIRPYANLLRSDAWGDFIVYKANSFAVTLGADRRETGTHYTPKSLTESIVSTTLEPVVYIGPAEGIPREEWKLKSSAELLDLKVCDPAMGSGAFLVQACRWLSERVVEAWGNEEKQGRFVTVDGEVLGDHGGAEPMPKSLDDRLIIARRLVTERCLYGVDINPLAVELAKLSIWLVTLAKGRPFGFLDHNLRSGDSLLGIHRLDQLTKLTMTPDDPKIQPRIFGQNIGKAVGEALELRKQLRKIPIRDIRDVEMMARLDEQARKKLERVELVADAMISEVLFSKGNVGNIDIAFNTLAGMAQDFLDGNEEIGKAVSKRARQALSVDLPISKSSRRPFHWTLEFPEVFEKGGFDGIVGNPPFMGGQKITGNLGVSYRDYLLEQLANGKKGSADLCAYFFLRNATLLRPGGHMGLLATNSIAQGSSREVGLQQLEENNYNITQAISSRKWPGKASLEISHVWLTRGKWNGDCVLDEKSGKEKITSYLARLGQVSGDPYQLKANEKKSFQGVIVLGLGFIMNPDEARLLIKSNPQNKDVLFPYLNGDDLNSSPDQFSTRWVINFFDWPLKREKMRHSWESADSKQKKMWLQNGIVPSDYSHRVAEDYPDCLAIVENKVKPDRLKNNDKGAKKYWWRFLRPRPDLYASIAGLNRVLIRAQVSRTWGWALVPEGVVYDAKTVVFAYDDYCDFASFQSSIHFEWAVEYMTTLRTDMSYTPTRQAETYPLPLDKSGQCDIGQRYYEYRQNIMKSHQKGLTAIYNLFNDPEEFSKDIVKLRDLHVEMDNTVVAAYDWDDLDLGHGFYETKQGLRFTISQEARREVLQRLLKLNHERYAEEVAQGLHDKGSKKKRANNNEEESLFDSD